MKRIGIGFGCVVLAALIAWLVWGGDATPTIAPTEPPASSAPPTPTVDAPADDAGDEASPARESVTPATLTETPTDPSESAAAEVVVVVRVVDATTSQPVPDVRVVLTSAGGDDVSISVAMPGGEIATFRPDEIATRTTDALGEVRLAIPPDSDLEFRVRPPFIAEPLAFHSDASMPREFTLRVTAAAQFTGLVETTARKPIHGASVSVSAQRADGSAAHSIAHGSTDEAGRYTIDPFVVEPGATYRLTASRVGFASAQLDRVEPVPGKVVEVEKLVLTRNGIRVFGTLVGDTFTTDGTQLELHGNSFGVMTTTVGAGGAFEFFVPRAGNCRLEFDGFCIGAAGVVPISILAGSTEHECGIVRASKPAAHYRGRVLLADDAPATAGHVRFGDFMAQIGADGSFDLVTCAAGPLPLDVWWTAGDDHSNELFDAFTFTATTDNVIRVQPRGVLVRVVESGGALKGPLDANIEFSQKDSGAARQIMTAPGLTQNSWRIQSDAWGHVGGAAGPATVTLRVEGKLPLVREIQLGAQGLRGPEIEVTFDLAELQDA